MKPILLIDFDGTLCHDRFWRSLEPSMMEKVQRYLFGPDNKTVVRWMKGGHTSEEINEMLSEELGLDYDVLWSTFVRECETMFVDDAVLEKIALLRDRYTIVLATDNMDCLSRFTVPALGLDDYFDEVANSYYEQASKNDDGGALLRDLVLRNGGEIKDSILIDNSKSTCDVFEGLGGKSLFVTKEQPLKYWLDHLFSQVWPSCF